VLESIAFGTGDHQGGEKAKDISWEAIASAYLFVWGLRGGDSRGGKDLK